MNGNGNIKKTFNASELNKPNSEGFKILQYEGETVIRAVDSNGDELTFGGALPSSSNRILVTTSNFATTLGGIVDSTKEYFLDGIVDCAGVSIEVPANGINIQGYNFNISKLIDSTNSFTLFSSPLSGSGDLIFSGFAIEVTGSLSKVYDLTDAIGSNSIEVSELNYNNCTSLGELNGYMNGMENQTGRYGGKPNLILSGTWGGGYFIDTSRVRNLTNGVYSIFEEGTAFSMASRFRSNQNIDLPADASFFNFQTSNFVNPSTVQITDAIISRNGNFDASDSNISPNMDQKDLASSWTGNKGLPNTYEGGTLTVSSETTTSISSSGVFVDLAGTFAVSEEIHQ